MLIRILSKATNTRERERKNVDLFFVENQKNILETILLLLLCTKKKNEKLNFGIQKKNQIKSKSNKEIRNILVLPSRIQLRT